MIEIISRIKYIFTHKSLFHMNFFHIFTRIIIKIVLKNGAYFLSTIY